MSTIEDFRRAGKELIDYICDFMKNIREREAKSSVSPGYLVPLIPSEAPEEPEKWDEILKDVERVIMPGVTHWSHPHFFAFYASASPAMPSILGDMLTGAIGGVGFSWDANPACTELEMIMMDWVAKLIGLPEHFLFSSKGPGGGVIQGTASEATHVSILSARSRYTRKDKDYGENVIGRLVAYTSKQAHSSVEKGAMLAGVQVRLIETNENFSMSGERLKEAIKKDKANGLIPFHCTATLGTTGSCAFDNLKEIGEVCQEENIWLHVDAAYAGSAFICEEFRHYMEGVEFADSFNFNLHKWMLVAFDCSAMYLKNSSELVSAFHVDPVFLKHQFQDKIPDYRHWQIALGRRFRALKVWFTLRLYGKLGMQEHIRNLVKLAKQFESLLRGNCMFEIAAPVVMGLVCFRIRGPNKLTEELYEKIKDDRKIFLVAAKLNETYVLRLAIVNYNTNVQDIEYAYELINKYSIDVIKVFNENNL